MAAPTRRPAASSGAKAAAGSKRRKSASPRTGLFSRVPKIFAVGPRDGVGVPLHAFNKFVLDAFLGGGGAGLDVSSALNYYGRVRFHHFRAMIPASGVSGER
jgi:hypothetical protein